MIALDAARDYIRRGWRVVPIPTGEKGPRINGWQNLAIGIDNLPLYFGAQENIGVILGPVSGELVDIDLDCPETVALSPLYLPPTQALFGRASKPRSHWLYTAAGAVHEVFSDPRDGTTLLELRAAGRDGGRHQTVFPPSLHPSGERVEWCNEIIAPAVVSAVALRTAAAWLATGALVRRHLSPHASERPGADFPDLLEEADPVLGEAARCWLRLPGREAPRPHLRPRRELTVDDIEVAELMAAVPNNADWESWNAIGLVDRILLAERGIERHVALLSSPVRWERWLSLGWCRVSG